MNPIDALAHQHPQQRPHRRQNLLTGQWVLVSPHRMQRPWQGQQDAAESLTPLPSWDASCYLCAENKRANGELNPRYQDTFVFTNDFAALTETGALEIAPAISSALANRLLISKPAHGVCRVICFSPDHGRTLPELRVEAIDSVVQTWQLEAATLGEKYQWVQIFENKGAMMGCSSPHPHGQIWATDYLPSEAVIEDAHQRDYYQQHGRPLLVDYGQAEAADGSRVVVETEHWLAVVPYWASWPFETLLMSKAAVQRITELTAAQSRDLSHALKRLTSRYDNLFQCAFPYSMGWHGAPFNDEDASHWQLHAHFYPPLLRSALVRKFMVGYEMLAEAQRDLTPEQAAERLRTVSDIHYRERETAKYKKKV